VSDFKTQLQELIDEAAIDYQNDPYNDQQDERTHFKQGSQFLMPLIERLIECREDCLPMAYIEGSITGNRVKFYSDKELLNLLKDGK
jgi:hypothetical protein